LPHDPADAHAHPALAVSAFRARLHVWMEKPAAVGVAGVDAMLAERGDQVAGVGYKKAFMPATCKALELIENKELETVRTVLSDYPMSVPARTLAISFSSAYRESVDAD